MTKTESRSAASPDDLLKAAVAGKSGPEAQGLKETKPEETKPKEEAAAPEPKPAGMRVVAARLRPHARLLGSTAAALALGAALGAGAVALSGPGRVQGDAVAAIGAGLDAGRGETARLAGEVAQVQQILSELRASTDAARKDAAARGADLGERVARLDRTVVRKFAALAERIDQSEREQNTRIAALAAQPERKPAALPQKPEPAQTGTIPEARGTDPKLSEAKASEGRPAESKPADARGADAKGKPVADRPPVIDGWALRDVFDGAAILENRRRRIVEVGPGDTLPGVGRVEAVERRGRDWVVVTRQGLVTAQPW